MGYRSGCVNGEWRFDWKAISWCLILVVLAIVVVSCAEEGPETPVQPPTETGKSRTYAFIPANGSQVTGTVKMSELNNGAVKFTVRLTSTTALASYPSLIRNFTGVEGGAPAAKLATVEGTSGEGFTVISKLDNLEEIDYTQMEAFDGHIAIRASEFDTTVVAYADIGSNELSGRFVRFQSSYANFPGVSGTMEFAERLNGSTLATTLLLDAPENFDHPVRLVSKTGAEIGSVLVNMGMVDSITGLGEYNIRQFVNREPVTYSQLLEIDGHVSVYFSLFNFTAIIGQFEIGQNTLTGNYKTYQLIAVDGAQLNGSAILRERQSGGNLFEILLEGTEQSVLYPASIHANPASVGGPVLATLSPIQGNTGLSRTTLRQLADATPISYNDLVLIDAHIEITSGGIPPQEILAIGDIGVNAP